MTALPIRRTNWEDVEIRFFLSLWAEGEVQQQLDGTVRNKKVFDDMARKMADAGYNRSPNQLRDKLKKLKKDYKDARSNNATSGAARQQCPFYDLLHPIMGNRPAIEPQVLVDTADDRAEGADVPAHADGADLSGRRVAVSSRMFWNWKVVRVLKTIL
ncbi:uncharacterized protein LOC115923621 [Strongylocentrotus purpuratus]|uniref:Myb/SANT-like DNA-binding domain-containing protein n=1 Tax=Strongylocentrotus purpuratus TaxID=7668 RepID=A0A7M7NWV6_STRPU|nr:uncharacterized protein LOC115923621 [Strongylocentrotus purpuratus]